MELERVLPTEGFDYEYIDDELYKNDSKPDLKAWHPIRILRGEFEGIVFQVRAVDMQAMARGEVKFDSRITKHSTNNDKSLDMTRLQKEMAAIVTAVITDWCEDYEIQKRNE